MFHRVHLPLEIAQRCLGIGDRSPEKRIIRGTGKKRLDCGQGTGSLSGFQPREQSATDRPLGQGDQARGEQKQGQEGKLQDLSRTSEQPGSDVGKSTGAASSSSQAACAFKPGDKIEAEVSDMGAATMIKKVSDKSKAAEDKGSSQQPKERKR